MPTPAPQPTRTRLASSLAATFALLVAALPARAEDRTGEQIYRESCASCHGAKGEGTLEEYPHALVGERKVDSLAKLIGKTMPSDDPGSLSGPDAEKVSAYIHEAFYSAAAQTRNQPKIELSRLTVRQYRNVLTDLMGALRGDDGGQPTAFEGLKGSYYKSRRFRDGEKGLERVDAGVGFDFGRESPAPDKLDPLAFSIRWTGSVFAPETGEYELVVKTEHAARLYLNDDERPLIDAWVKSGTDTEFKATIYLLGGRTYPLRLEWSKATQGVDDSDKKKKKPDPAPASIALEWTIPGRVREVIPGRYLATERSPSRFVCTVPFPPDDRTAGYERGTSVSKAWDEATTEGAIQAAGYILERLPALAGVKDDTADREAKLKAFCEKLAALAFRRPLDAESRAIYVDEQFAEAKDLDQALKRSLLLVLKSPRFLYRELGRTGDAHDLASRLSFSLWDSLPDEALRRAAAKDELKSEDQIVAQANRMAANPRCDAKLREFLLQWLRVDQVPDLSKSPERFPGFDATVAADLRASLELFLEDVLRSDAVDFRRLLLDDEVYLNGRLAKVYGAESSEDPGFRKVKLDGGERAGVLTHPYLMAAFAYTAASSPIHRGVFLARGIMGRSLRPPPIAVAPLAPDLHPNLTTRERVTLQTSPAECQTCHTLINPLGFSLEHFDAIGKYRTEEQGKPIDATAVYQTKAGEQETFTGVRQLAAYCARSEEVQSSFVEQLFHYLVKQPIQTHGFGASATLRKSLVAHEFNIRKLVVEIATATALLGRPTPSP
jgi:cytochrome c553